MIAKKSNIGKLLKTQTELLECVNHKEWIVWTNNFKQYNTAVARAFVNRPFIDIINLLNIKGIFKYKKNKT
jgi:hypothetical protein